MISTKMKPFLRLLGFTSILLSSNAQAIALGEIHLDSTLLQPLHLYVDLIEVEGVLPGSMVASVADPAQFRAAGLTYQQWYSELDVNIVNNSGNYVVQVLGQQPVEEAELNFIFEVNHLGGRLLAEYAVQLPAFVATQQAGEQSKAQITKEQGSEQPAAEPQVVIQTIEAEVVIEEALVQLADSQSTDIGVEPVVLGPVWLVVKPGQTLWRIAVNNSPKGISPWQTLISLYRENPAAYRNGDIRQVLANSKLRLPTLGELNSLTAKQAKAAYDVLVPAPVKVQRKKLPKNQLTAAQLTQQSAQRVKLQQQVQNEQDKLSGLASQSKALQAEVKDLKADHSEAVSQQDLLAKTSKNLAQGVAVQEQDIKSLNQQRAQIETNILVLDQKFESTQANLNQAEQDLVQAKQALVETQENIGLAAQTKVVNDKSEQMAQWLSVVQMLAFLLLPIIVVAGLIWWIIGRGRRVLPEHQTPPEIAEDQPITLDPLADYDTKPSAKAADLHQGARKMQGGMPERSFIEELLQQQEKDEAQSSRPVGSAGIQDDQVHLSADVEAMLTGQRIMHNQADEPVEYLSHDEEMNTKLDLALSYRDMGEVAKAQSILHEVLKQGDAEQQSQASALLSSINKV